MSDTQTTSDLALLAGDPDAIARAADPAEFVIQALERSKAWLAEVLAVGGIEDIVELKSQAEAIRVYTRQKQLGKDSEIAATEIVRRAQRGIGLAIERGQKAGEIAKSGDIGAMPGARVGGLPGQARGHELVRPTDFVGRDELSHAVYPLSKGLSDDEFEQVIESAKEEGNLSQNNLSKKVRELASYRDVQADKWARVAELAATGNPSAQIAREVGMSEEGLRSGARKKGIEFPADKLTNYKRIDPLYVIEQIVLGLEVTETSLELVSYENVTTEQATEWLQRLGKSLRSIRKMQNELREIR